MELRPWTPDEQPQVLAAIERAFLSDPPESPEPLGMLEPARTLSCWDDGRPVATAAAFSLEMAVPGAVRPVAGVTLVSVQPTHRRRGLLRQMMQRQLTELFESGEAVAALWASESGIYGRFGYGFASRTLGVEVRRGDALRRDVPGVGEVEDGPVAEVRDRLGEVWQRWFATRPGEFARNDSWWDHVLYDPPQRRDGRTALRAAVLGDGTGYALFSMRGKWGGRGPEGEVVVREIVGTGDAKPRLWRYLLGFDLVAAWEASRLPLDDPLLYAVAEPRRLGARVQDGLFVRPVRVADALAQRTYAGEVDVVLDVTDPVIPGNEGRWHLVGGPDGAECTRTQRDANLSLGVEDLGAVYLGGTPLASLALSGRVVEQTRGALRSTARAFRGDVEPVCSHVF